ncbi:MAG: LCP family protein [Symploca sp. SIO2E9]|nr:LCP family protein [Symploca sp. SIO2E9]
MKLSNSQIDSQVNGKTNILDKISISTLRSQPEHSEHSILESTIKQYLKWLFWGSAFVLTATISATLGTTLALITPLSPLITPQNQEERIGSKQDLWRQSFRYDLARPVNILVMGIDRVFDEPLDSTTVFDGRSDTMLLLRLDPTDNSVKMLSIPRDTQVEIPEVGIAKINDANVVGGSALAAQVVSSNLNNVPIDRYLRITTDAFRELVDLLGGVEVFVPYPMQYQDLTQNLEIDLEQGWQILNGDQAEQFVRFRNLNGGDISRIQRQQVILKALLRRASTPSVLPRLPKVIRLMQQYIDTNLSSSEILALAGFGLELEQDDFKMVLLPGRFSTPDEYFASYWIMNSRGRDRVMREYFQHNLDSAQLVHRRSPNRVRIAIQNATGDPELSYGLVRYLAQHEFYNVYFVKDWSDHLYQTQIIVQQGDLEAAATLQEVLGVGRIEASSTGDIKSELTIRLGEDWRERLL